jgi:hypothetical protein
LTYRGFFFPGRTNSEFLKAVLQAEQLAEILVPRTALNRVAG